LINNSGYEQPLALEFSRHVSLFHSDKLRYVHFDFHHECKKMQWHRISILMDQITADLDQQKYSILIRYCKVKDGKVVQSQTSTVRTNCIDCLDRTNVVQSILAKRTLEIQFREMGILAPQDTLESMVDFYPFFRHGTVD
jgi:hypothetical protein